MSKNKLHDLVNVYTLEGKWLGQFMDKETAVNWIKSNGYKLSDHEISTRRPERKLR
jgi:hypothetical protein